MRARPIQRLHCKECGRWIHQNANVLHLTASTPFEAWHHCLDGTFRQPVGNVPSSLRLDHLAQHVNSQRL